MVSPVTAKIINASYTDAAFLFLLTVTPTGEPPIYLVNNLEEVVSRGIKYLPYAFSITLPNNDTTKTPSVQLAIDNVDKRLINAIRETKRPPRIKLELITTYEPDSPEKTLDFLELRDVQYTAQNIVMTLAIVNVMSRSFPKSSYDPVQFPDLFY